MDSSLKTLSYGTHQPGLRARWLIGPTIINALHLPAVFLVRARLQDRLFYSGVSIDEVWNMRIAGAISVATLIGTLIVALHVTPARRLTFPQMVMWMVIVASSVLIIGCGGLMMLQPHD